MLKTINKEELVDYLKKLKIDYKKFSKWIIDETQEINFFIISTSNLEFREETRWNTEGREIYDANKLREHSQKVHTIIDELGLKLFLIQHGYENSIWFPEIFNNKQEITKKISFLKENQVKVSLNKFDGGFLIDGEISEFITSFIDYPYIFKYNDIECISIEEELIIRITHHLTIDFITSQKDINDKIVELCKNIGLSFIDNYC